MPIKVKKNKKASPKPKITTSNFSKIIIENFKGYNKLTNVDLCPGVNLIYGKNSAGKSSIIQSLRFIRQNLLLLNATVPFIPISPVNMSLGCLLNASFFGLGVAQHVNFSFLGCCFKIHPFFFI